MVGPSAAFVGTRDRQSYHVTANQAETRVFATSVNVVQALDLSSPRIVAAFGMEDKTGHMNELSPPSLLIHSPYLETQVALSLHQL